MPPVLNHSPDTTPACFVTLLLLLLSSCCCCCCLCSCCPVPPAALTIQQTLLANEAITMGRPVPPTASLLPQSNSLMGMVSGMSGALLSPAFAVSTKASSKGSRPRVVLSRVDTSVALQV